MANVNEVYTADGEELINLTNDTVSELSLLSGATAHDASGEQIVGKAQYINPNFVINSNFKINQRGKTEYVEVGYGVDGWVIPSETKYDVATKTLSAKSSSALETYVEQTVENVTTLRGKEVTFSGEATSTGTCEMKIYAFNDVEYTVATSGAIEEGIASCTMIVPEDTTQLFVRVLSPNASKITIEWVKLELGTVATPHVDPDEALEMIKCQRTLQFHTTGDINPIDLRPTMRITPTVTQMEDGRWMYNAEL